MMWHSQLNGSIILTKQICRFIHYYRKNWTYLFWKESSSFVVVDADLRFLEYFNQEFEVAQQQRFTNYIGGDRTEMDVGEERDQPVVGEGEEAEFLRKDKDFDSDVKCGEYVKFVDGTGNIFRNPTLALVKLIGMCENILKLQQLLLYNTCLTLTYLT